MHRQFGNTHYRNGFAELGHDPAAIAQSGQLDALVALECIGTRLSFSRNDEIYAEGDGSDCWYKVVSGTVRVCKLLADGRRHIAEFCLSGDCFGVDGGGERGYSAEAVDDVIVMRYQRASPLRTTGAISPAAQTAVCRCNHFPVCRQSAGATQPHHDADNSASADPTKPCTPDIERYLMVHSTSVHAAMAIDLVPDLKAASSASRPACVIR